jgi:amino acid transporter
MASHEVKSEGYSSEAHVKREYSGDEVAVAEEGGLSDPNHVDLHRALKARHITMIGS